ncbi:metalloregulator ArsR/SmtB family transcription factor [Nonomuraea sp. NEAU-L178]|nr:metalloregulator ArsR/SmtB family transcription factor [Nonomuraea aurantiaca]MCA2224623.1 metalloregulator ArsR/SmtB family transcription factor [Nonomuraea aurantiaca]
MSADPDGGRCVSTDIAAGISPAAALFHSLADETRLRIVQRLTRGEARVVDLTAQLGLAQSTVSKHLACLRDCGLVDYRTEGRQSFYSLTRPELMDLLASAEQLLAATGHAIALCPVYGTEHTDGDGSGGGGGDAEPVAGEPVAGEASRA